MGRVFAGPGRFVKSELPDPVEGLHPAAFVSGAGSDGTAKSRFHDVLLSANPPALEHARLLNQLRGGLTDPPASHFIWRVPELHSPQSPRVKISDIAGRAGVTKATVSLALRDRVGVSEALRVRIKALAQEMGYLPDPALSALASYRMAHRPPSDFNVIPFLTNYRTPEGWMKDIQFHRAIFEGARECGRKLGYSVENFWMKQARPQRMAEILKARGIRGLLLAPTPFPVSYLRLDWSTFASVATSFSVTKPLTHYAVSNMYQGMSMLWHELWHLGYRRPGLAIPEVYNRRGRYRWLASHMIEQRIRQDPGSHVPTLLFSGEAPEKREFLRWYKKARPDVVLCICPEMIAGFLQEAGIAVPDEVGIASLEVFEADAHWSGINQHPFEIGTSAMELLNSLIMTGACGIPAMRKGVFIETSWHPGSTIKIQPKQKPAPARRRR